MWASNLSAPALQLAGCSQLSSPGARSAFADARDGWACNMVIGEALRFGSSRDPGGNCQPSQRPLSPSRPRPARPNNDGQQNRCGACNVATVPTGSCLVMPLPPWDPIVRVAT